MSDLRIKDLVVEYASGQDTVRPIDGLSLDVAEGSLAILLGPSGCGKTTLLSCLGGILKPTKGRIEFGDIDLTALNAQDLSTYRRNTVGIVFQAFNLVPSLTALENVMVPLRAARIGRDESRERAEALLSRVGLAARMHHRPGDMSGGQQQRVAVARAIALDPPLLIADEPTAHPGTGLRRTGGRSGHPRHPDAAAGRPGGGTGSAPVGHQPRAGEHRPGRR